MRFHGEFGMSLTFKNILYESADGVAKIRINRPPLNVLNTETLLELTLALERARNDPSVSVVLITGVGDRAFCAGVDVKDHFPDRVNSTLSVFNKVFFMLENLDKPTVAVVNGVALGGGCELAMGCDMVVASERAQFGQPEIRVGAIAPVAVVLLPKLVGRKKALELVLTGDVITAAEAKAIGLVNRVVPPEKLDEASMELVGKLKENSPVVLKLVRMAFRETMDMDFKGGLDKVTGIYLNLLMRTEDSVEGLRAFLEKRKPQWKGK
jgi:cyclohexa-1,5-dienecarbonyl-CoA hydratase